MCISERKLQNVGHDLLERPVRDDLVVGSSPQKRFDLFKICQNLGPFFGRLAVRVVRPRADALEHDLGRRTEQNNGVETRVELALIAHAPAHEEDVGILGIEQMANFALEPEPVAVWAFFTVAVIGIDGFVALCGECADDRCLARPRHPGKQDSFHGFIVTRLIAIFKLLASDSILEASDLNADTLPLYRESPSGARSGGAPLGRAVCGA